MAKSTAAIPKGYRTVSPSLFVAGAAKAIDFYKKALGAEEVMRFAGPDGKIMHAEIRIGDSTIMLGDEMPEQGGKGPKSIGGTEGFLGRLEILPNISLPVKILREGLRCSFENLCYR